MMVEWAADEELLTQTSRFVPQSSSFRSESNPTKRWSESSHEETRVPV
jgi:hypothetical protein